MDEEIQLRYWEELPDIIGEKIMAREGTLSQVLTAERLVDYAKRMGKHLISMRFEPFQIGRFLNAVNGIKAKGFGKLKLKEILLLKIPLAFPEGKWPHRAKPLTDLLSLCVEKIDTWEDFKTFIQFYEAILAYHRYYGGKGWPIIKEV